ncbi:bifunctional aspartate kinase/homoserine dehydrogenase I [Enterobacteriaceae endosymbiont of Plateumaris braccata]|uniref:bifunctional aspartate kinase/homoserine dehydrogenase I n=1 Tax=Enterobacteriaceae endosymbiont of Plateumaris braccata TaxID=2675793 RepID=UPI001449299F|nr:bifunctional aspartate kinase/homoserine dehydrogenase I [Enterobacteriaceae endosymbiont of Plateumaris braccata]QJC28330.1 bifunctional aspartate kinase/homoserine dehydrogenase I [Enterobacteriaceae endosymbiont of Plateumaris braccata]
MRVLKFGGTSLSNAKKFLMVVNIISNYSKKEKLAIVLSASSTITNYLILIIKKAIKNENFQIDFIKIKNFFLNLIQDLSSKEENLNISNIKNKINIIFLLLENLLNGISLLNFCPDMIYAKILAQGEKFSVIFMQELLVSKKYNVYILDPKKYLFATGDYLESKININISSQKIKNINLLNIDIILMAGFTASNKNNELVLLGRNGSDYSASALAACLNVKHCEIWTDVDGIYTADPNLITKAKLLPFISYNEATILSYLGAKVIHYNMISPISKYKIQCIIKNTMNPQSPGTLISENNNSPLIKSITKQKNVVMFYVSSNKIKTIQYIIPKMLDIIFKSKIIILLMIHSSSKHGLYFYVFKKQANYFKILLENNFGLEFKNKLINPLYILEKLSIISLVGDKINNYINIITKFLHVFKITKINILAISQNFLQNSISIVIKNNYVDDIMKIAHQLLFYKEKVIEVFVIGIGGIGSTLLEQINNQQKLLKNKSINIKICGIFNSKSSLININGINLNNWFSQIKNNYNNYTIENFISNIKQYKFINPVIIDCTSSQKIAYQYINFFNNGFHVIATNKKANTSSLKYYKDLRITAKKNNCKFFYETNVGAGLPVIFNLQNLINTGDKLINFTGILSGSLSFIFGKLEEGISLSKATYMAKKMGFTEPDPRIDLSGIDVARKLLILAREIGYDLELNDIQIESIIPNKFNNLNSVKEFMSLLPELDSHFDKKIQNAKKENKVLRFIGSINKYGICKVQILQIDKKNPLFEIKNGENALAFYSKYYQPIPLVLRGYGAGNKVTASGVFADLLRTII